MKETISAFDSINVLIQKRMNELDIQSISPVKATQWLVEAGIRNKVDSRPGSYIRNLCRKGLIQGATQHDKKWIINRL